MNTDSWTERWPEHPVIRTFDPPRAVQVHRQGAAARAWGAARADDISMRVKSSSVYLSGMRPALQTHWFQIHDSQWLAAVTVYVTDAAGTNSLELDMIVIADAISEPPFPELLSTSPGSCRRTELVADGPIDEGRDRLTLVCRDRAH